MKESPKAKAYLLLTIFLRKIVYIAVMITFVPMIECAHILHGIATIELFLTVYLMRVRPYDTLQNNLIELTNQLVFMTLVVLLFFFNQPQHWDATWEVVVMVVVTANNLIVVLILFSRYLSVHFVVFLVKSLISKIGKWCNQDTQVDARAPSSHTQVSFISKQTEYITNDF